MKLILSFRLFLAILITLYYSIRALITTVLKKNKRGFHHLARRWSALLLKTCKIKVQTIFKENLQRDRAYIFISNHSSLIDIPVITHAVGGDIRIIYKKELEKIPLFGSMMSASPYIPIIRSDARNSMSGINEAIKSIKGGDSVIIFPEGTRSLDGKLHEFKRGAFLLASRAAMPIVPVSIIGTFDILPSNKKLIKPGLVKVIFDKPILITYNSREEEKELMYKVYNIIHHNIELPSESTS